VPLCVYVLLEPETLIPRYVGSTTATARERLNRHSLDVHREIPSTAWIRELVQRGSRPAIRILNPDAASRDEERAWIDRLRDYGFDLLNRKTVRAERCRTRHYDRLPPGRPAGNKSYEYRDGHLAFTGKPLSTRLKENTYRKVYLPNHPLARKDGSVLLSRAILYEKVGPFPCGCHWCGADIRWAVGEPGPNAIVADHIDTNRGNDVASNLVPSCSACNVQRSKYGKIKDDELQVLYCGNKVRARKFKCRICGTEKLIYKNKTAQTCSQRCTIIYVHQVRKQNLDRRRA
jgi:hypothetical protein